MRRRFTINSEGNLVDRNGSVLGKVTAVTIDVPPMGVGGSSVVLGEIPQTTTTSPLPPGVAEVWAYFIKVREDIGRPVRNKVATPSMNRLIEKGLKEVEGPADLMRGIDGVVEWQKQRGGDLDLSRLLGTHPRSRPLREQIEFFMGCAGEGAAHGGTRSVSSEEMVKINRLKDEITGGWRQPHRRADVQRAIMALAERGWEVDFDDENEGHPVFRAP